MPLLLTTNPKNLIEGRAIKVFSCDNFKFALLHFSKNLSKMSKWSTKTSSPIRCFPEYKLILSSLVNIVNLTCYKNDPLLMSFVDGLITHFGNTNLIDIIRLKKFFEFNDKLDNSREIQLKDYIPELEEYRQRCYNIV